MRDLDVLLGDASAYRQGIPDARAGTFDCLLDAWQEERAVARRRLVRELRSRRYRRFVEDFRDWLRTEPVPDPASGSPPRVRDRAADLVRDACGPVWAFGDRLQAADTRTPHRLRIRAKHLRYTLEAFAEVLQGSALLVDRVVALQDHLGLLNDADVAVARTLAWRESIARQWSTLEPEVLDGYVASRRSLVGRQRASLAEAWAAVGGDGFREAVERSLAALQPKA